MPSFCGVIELRRYTLHPGRRDELIDLFDAHLVEPQEALGMHVVGQFRDMDRPDRFVWLRGFPDMPARAQGLTDFYLHSAAWAAHAKAANATMIDSDDVFLLRPVAGAEHICAAVSGRPSRSDVRPAGVYTIAVHHVAGRTDEAVAAWQQAVGQAGAAVVGLLRTDHTPNNFPRLPVREDADVLVAVIRHDSHAARHETANLLRATHRAVEPFQQAPPETLVLEPTSRSALR